MYTKDKALNQFFPDTDDDIILILKRQSAILSALTEKIKHIESLVIRKALTA
jgi:hypothetical protein